MGLITNLVDLHLNHQHDADLAAQKNYLDMYHTIATDPSNDPEVRRQSLMEYADASRQAPGKFRKPEYGAKVQKNLQDWYQLAQTNKMNQPQQSPPPTQSLASQGPPGGSAPPPPSGNNYGPYVGGPPSATTGQMTAKSQPANDAMSSQGVSVPPPPPMQPQSQGVAPPAASNFQGGPPAPSAPPVSGGLPYDPVRSELTSKTALWNAQYGSQYAAQGKAETETALAKAVNERTLREQDLKKVQPLIDALPDHPTMRDYAKLEVGASTILGRPFTIPGMASMSKPQFYGIRSGSTALPGTLDVDGQPVSSTSSYRLEHNNLTGEDSWIPTIAQVGRVVMPDPESPTKWSVFEVDRMGNVQGKTQGATPPAAYAPITRNGVREQVVDFGDHKELINVRTSNTSGRSIPGVPAVPAPPSPAGNVPSAKPSSVPPAASAVPGAPAGPSGKNLGRVDLGMKRLGPAQVMPMKNSIEVASHQLWGDPDNPSLRPLASYANLADDQGARQRLGQALRLVLDAGGDSGAEHLGASAGPVSFSAGNLGTALSYNLGIPQAAADAKATALRDIFAKMKPEEVDYFNSLMNAIPTITGFRKLTSGGAFRWSQQGLERELPMIGLSGVTSSSTYAKKMAALGDEPLTAIKNLERFAPGAIDPRLTVLIKGGGRGVAPSGPPGSKPTNAVEFMQKYGIKPQ